MKKACSFFFIPATISSHSPQQEANSETPFVSRLLGFFSLEFHLIGSFFNLSRKLSRCLQSRLLASKQKKEKNPP